MKTLVNKFKYQYTQPVVILWSANLVVSSERSNILRPNFDIVSDFSH